MRAELVSFGVIEIEGRRFEHDVVIQAGVVRKRIKKPSKPYQVRFGHTPLSIAEEIPWAGLHLIIGTGASGQLPVMDEVIAEAARRGVQLTIVPTTEACRLLAVEPAERLFAILHVTC